MPHASNVVRCDGPDSPHAFDLVPLCPRNGSLDARCPICRGHGQWNTEIDLVSFRCARAICPHCDGAGWVETGDDPVGVPDIVMAPEGYARWIVRFVARVDAGDADAPGGLGVAHRPAAAG
jgi:hypothetical protein